MSVIALAIAAAAEAHSEETSASLPQLDLTWWPSQLFWLAVTFGLLYWLMASRFLPAIGTAIEERRDRIADDLDQAAEFRRQAEEAEAQYNQNLSDARAKAQSIAATTRDEVDQKIASMQAETDAALEQKLNEADTRINAMKENAAATVRTAAADTTKAIVETLLDEVPTDESVAKAIDLASAR